MQAKFKGVITNYQQIGKKGPILIMLHGWGCDWKIFNLLIERLSDDYQLVIPDLPTFGNSNEPKEVWGVNDFVAWLEEFIAHTCKNKKYFLLGHSFGGQIASALASKNPANLQKLILIDSAGLADPLPIYRKLQELSLKLVPDRAKQLISNKIKKNILNFIGASIDHLEATLYQRKILKLVTKTNIKDKLIKIKVPTLIIWGQTDEATPLHQAEVFHQLIENSKLEICEQSGHFPFLTEPIKVANLIRKFIKK